jgi:hypothetical protein
MTLSAVTQFKPGVPPLVFNKLLRLFPQSHFERLSEEGFHFYHTTFWYPLDRSPENTFESVVTGLREAANPSSNVIGVEWWLSVLQTNVTPQWLLRCHFDRNDLAEKNLKALKHPEKSSVLFWNAVPYGELVVTDQVLTENGTRPAQPHDMAFIRPSRNLYVVFPGQLYHGVIGRMWRPIKPAKLRITMAVNWWTERPKASYLYDSRECMTRFRLDAGSKGTLRAERPRPAS